MSKKMLKQHMKVLMALDAIANAKDAQDEMAAIISTKEEHV